MKKYFMQGTADELHYGDWIKLDVTEDLHNGKTVHHHINCKFSEPLIPLLLEEGIIEEQKVKDKDVEEAEKKILDFCDKEDSCIINETLKLMEEVEHRVERLEDIVTKLANLVTPHAKVKYPGSRHKKNATKAC